MKNPIALIIDAITGVTARVSDDGRLKVSIDFTIPEGKTPVLEGGKVAITGNGGTNTFNWIIPDGEDFVLSSFEFGGYVPDAGQDGLIAKSELYYQPNGNTTGEVLLDIVYLQGVSGLRVPFGYKITGDGIKRLSVVTINQSDKVGEFKRFVKGYY